MQRFTGNDTGLLNFSFKILNWKEKKYIGCYFQERKLLAQ